MSFNLASIGSNSTQTPGYQLTPSNYHPVGNSSPSSAIILQNDLGYGAGKVIRAAWDWISETVHCFKNRYTSPCITGIRRMKLLNNRFNAFFLYKLPIKRCNLKIASLAHEYQERLLPFEKDDSDIIWAKMARAVRGKYGPCAVVELCNLIPEFNDLVTEEDILCMLVKELPHPDKFQTYDEVADIVAKYLPQLKKSHQAVYDALAKYGKTHQCTIASRLPSLKKIIDPNYCLDVGLIKVTPEMDKARLAKAANLNPENSLEDLIKANYPEELIKAVGGIEALEKIPLLDIGSYLGLTGYLDFIDPKDMTHPVMRGVDHASRPFLAVCHVDGDKRETVQVFFQRYADMDEKWNWVMAYYGDGYPHLGRGSWSKSEAYRGLGFLIRGEEVITKDITGPRGVARLCERKT